MSEASDEALTVGLLGLLLLAGYAAHVLGRRTNVPRVTLLLLIGVAVGPAGLDLAPPAAHRSFPLVAQIALSMVGFLLGEQFFSKKHRLPMRGLMLIAAIQTLVVAGAVFGLCLLAGAPPVLALILGAIAPASAPAATLDVIREARAEGPVADSALAVVAIDDAYGVVLFGVLLAFAGLAGGEGVALDALLGGLWETVGAVILGAGLGLPMAWLTGKLQPGEPTRVEALGFVLTCGGAAGVLHVSYLLACMTMGAVVAARAHHHTRPFHAIEDISQPLLVVFFLLTGFEFRIEAISGAGLLVGVYVLARSAGKLGGGWLGARVAGSPASVRHYLGLCLMPQAGVALGLGLLAAQRFAAYGNEIMSLLVATTLAFELLGPLCARQALRMAGELPDASSEATKR